MTGYLRSEVCYKRNPCIVINIWLSNIFRILGVFYLLGCNPWLDYIKKLFNVDTKFVLHIFYSRNILTNVNIPLIVTVLFSLCVNVIVLLPEVLYFQICFLISEYSSPTPTLCSERSFSNPWNVKAIGFAEKINDKRVSNDARKSGENN